MDISAVISNIGTAYTIISSLAGIRDGQKLATVQADLTERILKAQAHLAELLGLLMEKTTLAASLQEHVRQLESNQLERNRYELAVVAPGCGCAYRLKSPSALNEQPGEPPHFLCQPCLDVRGHKVILRSDIIFGAETFICPECKHELSGRYIGM